jgi:ATP-binding cassette subfamily B protein
MIPVRAYLALLSSNLEGLSLRVVALVVALLAGVALQLVNPQLLRSVIDGALAGEPSSALVPLAAVFIGVAVLHQVVAITATWLAEDVGWRATNRLRADLTAHVLDLDMGFHASHSPGHLIERVDGDVTALSNLFSAMVVKVVGNGLLIVGIVVLIARESWLLGLLVGGLIVLALGAFGRLHAIAVPWWKAVSTTQAEMYGQVGEQVDGTEDIVPNGAATFMQERFAQRLRAYLPQYVRGWIGFGLMWSTSQVLSSLMLVGIYLIGAWQFGVGTVTIGTIFLVVYYVEMIERPLHQLRDQFQDLQKAGGAVARIVDLQAVESALRPGGGTPLPTGPLQVTFEGVDFTYGEDGDAPRVLHDVDVVVPPGRSLGLIGRTGSGKSTLARLAVRLHEPDAGSVRIGGVPIGEVSDLRRHVGMVTQDVQLFRASVRDNLTFFDRTVPDDRLFEVIDELSLRPWLQTLNAGLDTVLDGKDLSAGQAQLLAFARIFLHDPGLVVLDEASSRLDPLTEALLERAIDRLLADRTAIVIAHRLHTLHRIDDVLVLDEGRVVEHGDRAALAADAESRFARLLATGMEEVLR